MKFKKKKENEKIIQRTLMKPSTPMALSLPMPIVCCLLKALTQWTFASNPHYYVIGQHLNIKIRFLVSFDRVDDFTSSIEIANTLWTFNY